MSEEPIGVLLTVTGPKALTFNEFAALDPYRKLQFRFNESGYTTPGFTPFADRDLLGIPSFAYRADTKEEFLVDVGVGIVKVGFAVVTGGTSAAAKTTLGYVVSLLS